MSFAFRFTLLWFLPFCFCISADDLYPIGEKDTRLGKDDDSSSPEIQLLVPIVFYDTPYKSVFVNTNGLLSFITELPSFFNTPFPLTYPIIAPFYSDVDTRAIGSVQFRETQESELLEKTAKTVRKHFSKGQNFRPRSLFIATWSQVGRYNQKTDLKNTFQVVVASDGSDSYALFLYPENGIQWIRGEGKVENMPDARAQSGFMSGDGRMYILPGSGSDRIQRYDRKSNINEAGVWVFEIGRTGGQRGNIQLPDIVEQSTAPNNCAQTSDPCSMISKCVDYRNGFCCHCSDGYFGNGRECVENDKFQRLFGKLNGYINKKTLENVALHSHSETKDGRSYTGISRVPPDLGPDMQALFTIGANIGWIFGKQKQGVKNGFSVTGGLYNRTVDIEFPNSDDHIHMKEYFLGPDVFGNINVNIEVRGTLPSIQFGSKVVIDDYADVYTRQSNNVIRSQSEKVFKIDESRVQIPFKIDQTIEFEECASLPENQKVQASRLEISRQTVTYDNREQIVRYTAIYAIGPLQAEDPCVQGKATCGMHSNCIADGNDFKCVCERGFELSPQNRKDCIDIDECSTNRHVCDPNADCFNSVGKYECRCKTGFTGDGFRCQGQLTCEELRCHPSLAMCVKNENGEPACVCKSGYRGDGRTCESTNDVGGSDCSGTKCDVHAECLEDPDEGGYKCFCKPGYTGPGVYCVEEFDICENCHRFAECLFDKNTASNYCSCKRGYTGDGYVCDVEDCLTGAKCHQNARCILNPTLGRHNCQCMPGFSGNGYQCKEEMTEGDCRQPNKQICSLDGECVMDPVTRRHVCRCRPGYEGNGMICKLSECRSDGDCLQNSRCDYDYGVRRYKCKCNPGFEEVGDMCKPTTQSPDCRVEPEFCHTEASCIFDPVNGRGKCECKMGWKGDGRTCVRDVESCRCDVNADCLHNTMLNRMECVCKSGFEGNGQTCRRIKTCNEDKSICDRNADCNFVNHLRSWACQCRPEYIGDGFQCIVIPMESAEYLIFAQGMSLLQMPLNPTNENNGQLLLTKSHHLPVGIDIDCVEGYMYWSDVFNHAIHRALYNGSQSERILEHRTDSPEGVAVDWISRNIYWTDSNKDVIQVASLDGRFIKTVISGELVDPRGIAVHPGFGKLYWTDWNREAPKIESSALDGSDRQLFVSTDLGLPNMLTIDFHSNELCWTDAGLKRIECKSLHTSSRRVVYEPAAYPFDITIANSDIYWTDWEQKFISKVNKYGGVVGQLDLPLGGNGKTYGIVTVREECPRMTNACAGRNGGCDYLCLPNGKGGRTCQCPDPDTEGHEECNSVN